jgi:hypothetical protein
MLQLSNRSKKEARMDTPTTTRPPTGTDVICRVWLGGLCWGPVTAAGVVLGWMVSGAVLDGVSVADLDEGVAMLLILMVIAVPIGLLTGLVAGLLAGLLLVAVRPLGDVAPWLVCAVTLVGLALACSAFTGPGNEFTFVLAVPVCLLSAWPVLHTLRKALRPTTARR